jgi:hypothetical protein
MLPAEPRPTPFESLAGICKFIAVQKISPAFYAKHQHPVEFASAFLRILASSYPSLEKSFRAALPLSVSEGSGQIRQALSSLTLSEQRLSWLDKQMTEVLRVLVPVVRDSELPEWLADCKWAIEGAFDSP